LKVVQAEVAARLDALQLQVERDRVRLGQILAVNRSAADIREDLAQARDALNALDVLVGKDSRLRAAQELVARMTAERHQAELTVAKAQDRVPATKRSYARAVQDLAAWKTKHRIAYWFHRTMRPLATVARLERHVANTLERARQAGPRLQTAQRILGRVIGDYRRERDVLIDLQARVSAQLENARRPFEGLIQELTEQLERATAREKLEGRQEGQGEHGRASSQNFPEGPK
jgi:hypothetical protein